MPHRTARSHLHFSLFSIFRHPIDRIGAQAFYGNTVGSLLLKDLIFRNCLPSSHGHEFNLNREFDICSNSLKIPSRCQCYYDSFREALNLLKKNETLWYEWFRTPGFGDQYMSNYYIKRMISGNTRVFPEAFQCIRFPELNCDGKHLLLELTPAARCMSAKTNNMTRARQIAESLLLGQYDFMILEQISHPSAPYLLASILREENVDLIHKLLQSTKSSNSGLLSHAPTDITHMNSSRSTLKYAYIFPESILNYLLVENAEDIALYDFAVKLYKHRVEHIMSSLNLPSASLS